MFLNDADIEKLTGRHRRDAQARALRHLGIDHRVRADGSIVVLEEHIKKVLGGFTEKKVRTKTTPNWGALNG